MKTIDAITISDTFLAKENRLSSKGLGLIFAYIYSFFFIYYGPDLVRMIWPDVLNFLSSYGIEKWHVFTFGLVLWHIFLYILLNLVYFLIYKLEHPFFEKYKVNDNPWPWKENYEEWQKMLWRTLKV